MSRRDSFPKPREHSSHYSMVLSRGQRVRSFRFRPNVLIGIFSIVPMLALGCFVLGLLFVTTIFCRR